jgi:hypothetical protein
VITTAELEQVRGEAARTFSSTATILRRTETRDSQGGTRITWVSAGSYDCTFAQAFVRPQEREDTPFVRGSSAWIFIFAVAVEIRTTDRLQVGTRTFEVINGSLGGEDIGRKVSATEIV